MADFGEELEKEAYFPGELTDKKKGMDVLHLTKGAVYGGPWPPWPRACPPAAAMGTGDLTRVFSIHSFEQAIVTWSKCLKGYKWFFDTSTESTFSKRVGTLVSPLGI